MQRRIDLIDASAALDTRQLVAKSSGKCLDLAAADAHANLTQAACSTASSQVWIRHPSLFE